MNYTIQQLQEAAQRTADSYAEIANKVMGSKLPIPVPLKFDLQNELPKAAGRANGTMLVEINMILFEDNIPHILNETIPHEIGHLVQYDRFDHRGGDTQGHGAEWKEIMRRLGKTPHKYHDLDVTRAVAHYKSLKKLKNRSTK